jgi:NADH:ubiquinone oxidoreductase subunit 5 (subunit L)/multisubunit Na+/H+ antiporter MnhA subunit
MLFVFSMCLLIFIPRFVFVLVGWDGLGLTRFFLIIYYKSFRSWTSGLKTYLINRLGDGLVIIALLKFYNQGH